MIVLAALALIGLAAAFFLPANPERRSAPTQVIAPDALDPATEQG